MELKKKNSQNFSNNQKSRNDLKLFLPYNSQHQSVSKGKQFHSNKIESLLVNDDQHLF